MKVAVIIVSYNFERWMEPCLESLRKSTLPVEVIVIDNGSKDKTIERIRTEYPEVTLIENETNQGFGKANNQGMVYALNNGFDFVFLLNQDAWIDPEVLETLVKLSETFPEYGILSPVHLTGKGDGFDKGFATYTGIKEMKELSTLTENQAQLISAKWINAALWLVPRRILEKVGGFSPVFFHRGEDIDYINRVNHHGYRVGFCPSVFGYHDRDERPPGKEDLLFQLIEYSNINYSFPKAFAFGVLAAFKKAFIALWKEGIHEFIRLFPLSFHLLTKTGLVLRYRKLHKKGSILLTE